jgi:guanine deaminase
MKTESARLAFMREAFAVARRSFAGGGGPFGTVIVLRDEIIASGMSLAESLHDPTAHAEVLAIRSAARVLQRINLSDCVAYSSAEPCTMCLSAFYWSRVPIVYYGTTWRESAVFGYEDLYVYEELMKPPASRAIRCQSLLQEEGLALLNAAAVERPYGSFLPVDWKPS